MSVTYVCTDGYTLQGEAELLCNLDTDEWQGDPPTCSPGMLSIFSFKSKHFQCC